MATGSLVSRYSEDQTDVILNRDCLRSHLQSVKKQLLLVSLIGPYQTGKSSFISQFTGENLVTIGNGSEEQTKGVWIFGPYELNALKRRWGVSEVPGDETKVAFIDTEGFGGETGKSNDENRILMCQLVAPFLAISQVCIVMHPANIEKASQETLKFILGVAERICSGANSSTYGEGNMKIVDLSIALAKYKTSEVDEDGVPIQQNYRPDRDPNKFQAASQYLRTVQSKRLGMDGGQHLIVDKFWPLPVFDTLSHISQQNEIFSCGFKLVSTELLSMLDEIRACHFISGEGAFAAFDLFQRNLNQENLQDMAKQARQLAELSTSERILQPSIDAIVQATKNDIECHLGELKDRLRSPDCTYCTPDDASLGFDEMISQALDKINNLEGLSSSIRESQSWSSTLSSVRAVLNETRMAAKNQLLEEIKPYQRQTIVSHVICHLADESNKLVTEVASFHAKKRAIDTHKMREYVSTLERQRDEQLKSKCQELRVSPELANQCKKDLSGDLSPYVEKLTKSAHDIVSGNQERYDKLFQDLIKVVIDQTGTVAKEFALMGCEILKAKYLHAKSGSTQ